VWPREDQGKYLDCTLDSGSSTVRVPAQAVVPQGVLPEKLDGGVRPASQNPYPIYDQKLRFSLPYLWWLDQKFDTLFITWPLNQYPVSIQTCFIISSLDQTNVKHNLWRAFLMVFSIMMKK